MLESGPVRLSDIYRLPDPEGSIRNAMWRLRTNGYIRETCMVQITEEGAEKMTPRKDGA